MNKFRLDYPEPAFSREFSTLKAMRQYISRNPALKAAPYVWHENSWQRFAIFGNQILPVSVLRSLLSSLETSQSLDQNDDCEASPTFKLPDDALN